MSAAELLRDNDTRFLGVMAEFSAAEWAAPSLCDEWTDHQVLAHLVIGYSAGPASFGTAILRARGGFDRANTALAGELAALRGPAELLDEMHRLRTEPRGLGSIFPKRLLLGDHVTHELDMLYALGKEPDIERSALIAVLNTQVSVPNPFVPAFGNSRGLLLMATDVDWAHGRPEHPAVRGSAAAIIAALGNRPAALPMLTGPGVDVLRSRHAPLP